MATKINFKQLGDDIINAIEISAYVDKENISDWNSPITISKDKVTLYNNETTKADHEASIKTIHIIEEDKLVGIAIVNNYDEGNSEYTITAFEYGTGSGNIPVASDTSVGGIKVGDNLQIDADGKLNVVLPDEYELPIASDTELGGIKVGENLEIDTDGILKAIIPDVSEFIKKDVDDLDNYDKSDEVDRKIAEAIADLGKLNVKIVSSILEVTEENVIYLIPMTDAEANNNYYEYMLINGNPELIGSTKIDLSDYYNKTEVDEAIADIIDDDNSSSDKVYSSEKIDETIQGLIDGDIANAFELIKELQDVTTKGIYVGYINSVTPSRSAMEEIIKDAIKAKASMIILRPVVGLPQDFVAISSGRNLQNYKDGGKGYMFFTDINEHSDSGDMPSVMSYTTKVNFTVTKGSDDEITVTIDSVDTDFVSGINSTAQHAYVLHTKNESEYTPTKDYHPATKKYVDDAVASASGGDGPSLVLQYESGKKYTKDTLVYREKYIARVLQDFTSSTIDSDLAQCWDDDIKLENIVVINTDHMHLMMEYGQGNYYEADILVYLGDLICRVVNDFTADNTPGNSAEDSFNADIGAGHLLLLNKEADHNIVEYKKGTFYEKDKLVWGDGRICRVLSNYTSNTNASYTLAQAIKRDMEKGYLEELGEKYKFKLYKTTMDLNKVIDSINIIPVSTIVFEDVDDIDIMRISEGIYGPLGTLALITKIDKNNQIIEAKTVNSREMEFMPPAPNEIRYTVVTPGSGYAVGDIVRTTNYNGIIFGEVEEVGIGGSLVKVKQTDEKVRRTNGAGGDVTAEIILFVANGKEWYEHNVKGANAVIVEYEQGKAYEQNNLIFYEDVLTRAAHDFTSNNTFSSVDESFESDIQNGHLIRVTAEDVEVPECLGSVKTESDFPAIAVKGNWVLIENCTITAPGQAGIGLYNGTSWDVTAIPQGDFQFPEPAADGKLYFRKVDVGNTDGQWEAFTKVDGNEIEITIKEKADSTDNNYRPAKGEFVWDTEREILVIGDGVSTLGNLKAFYGSDISLSDILSAIGYTPEDVANKGIPNGYAPLGADGKVPNGFLPDASTDTYSKSEIDAKDLAVQNAVAAQINSEASRAQNVENQLRTDLDDHINDASMHVTQNEKDNWDAKVEQSDLVDFQNHIDDTDIHVTQADKDRWDGMNKAYYVTNKSQLPLTGNEIGNIGYVQISPAGQTPVVCDQYIWDGTAWQLLDSSQISLQFIWGNIDGRPNSTPLTIDNAVTVAHNHQNKIVLDKIGQSAKGNFMYDGVEIGVKAIFIDHEQELPEVGEEDTLYVVYEDSRVRNYPSISVWRENAYQILGRGTQDAAPVVGDMSILQAEYFSVVAGSSFKISVTPNQYFCFMPLEILREIEGAKGQTRIMTDFTDASKFKYNEMLISINSSSRLTINIKEIPADLQTVSDKYYHTADVDFADYKDIDSIS